VLLNYIHGGIIYIDPPVSIDTTLIVHIKRFCKAGEDPTLLFKKMGERALSESMKEKIYAFIGKRDLEVRFMMQGFPCKLLFKCHKDKVLAVVISSVVKFKEGVQMNWDTFLVNQFLQYCTRPKRRELNFTMHGFSSSLH
jgi:hypothetical protein